MSVRPFGTQDGPAAKRLRADHDVPPEGEILRLVSEREGLRQQRRFPESDDIREQLRSMGVELFDKEKEWRCRDGRRGYLFTAGSSVCHLGDTDILNQISQREEARRSKDFGTADMIRDELRKNGVELNDKDRTWQTGNGRSGTYSGTSTQSGQMPGVTIKQLVAERERLRAAQDYDGADELRNQLAQMGVDLNDAEKIWRSTDGQTGVIVTGGADVDCPLNDMEINRMVQQREDKRNSKDWMAADRIRADLRANGVELMDKTKTWVTTDGRSGPYTPAALHPGHFGAGPPPSPMGAPAHGQAGSNAAQQQAALLALAQAAAAQVQAAAHQVPMPGPVASGHSLSDASIEALVAGRERCRERHDWSSADSIRADLKAHGVEVWDNNKCWTASNGRFGQIVRNGA